MSCLRALLPISNENISHDAVLNFDRILRLPFCDTFEKCSVALTVVGAMSSVYKKEKESRLVGGSSANCTI